MQGSTGNPFDRNLSAGASTGGGASAVASGIVPLATGSDFAGSLRTPAAFCGIAGMRPSNGIVGTNRRSNIWSPFDVEGPLAKTAADCKLLLGAMAKSCSVDPFSKPVDNELLRPARKIDLKNLNVAFSCRRTRLNGFTFSPAESCVGEIELLAPFFHEVVWWFQILGVEPLK